MLISTIQWNSFLTLVRKDTTRYLRSWSQTLLPSAVTAVLYFLIFGSVIGQRIGPMAGFSYIQYIAPGLILLAIINNSYMNSSTAFYLQRFTHAIEEVVVSSTKNSTLLFANIFSSMNRGLIVGLIVAIISLFFTHLHVLHFIAMVIIIVLTAVLFSIAGFINGIYAKTFDSIAFIPTFILTPLTYLGGVFYSVDLLPPFWQKVSLFNPILYMVHGFRYALLGAGGGEISFLLSCLVVASFIVAFYLWAWFLLKRGVGIKT